MSKLEYNPASLIADPRVERAACGTGFIANLSGQPTRQLVLDALSTVARLAHRGAIAADQKTGDGAGLLTQIPHRFFRHKLERHGIPMPAEGDLGIGMFFMPQYSAPRERARAIIADAIHAQGLDLIMWRPLSVDLNALGEYARQTCPRIEQVIIARGETVGAGDEFERVLYLIRKEVEKRARDERIYPFYIPSLSSRTMVFKGLFVATQLSRFYADLRDPLFESALALFHQRYSTNTFPTWERAQPFRMLCHNGEINTLQGNIGWMRARESYLASPVWRDSVRLLQPILDLEGSDSAMLDNALELLAYSGRETPHAMLMLMPEAWERVADMPESHRAFFRYHSTLMEPWDGPAAVAFADGKVAGMNLDRNGLRPARFLVTEDGLVVAASEIGALEVDPQRVIQKGKLGPGQMIVADLVNHKLWQDDELKDEYANRQPYQQWLVEQIRPVPATQSDGTRDPLSYSVTRTLSRLQAAYGYTDEELVVVIKPMAENGAEPVGSMGDDTPHAVLSLFERPLYHFFKQRFAEVTNPPIDPLREELVMSTRTLLGGRGNVLAEEPGLAHVLELNSPFLSPEQFDYIRSCKSEFPHASLDITFTADENPDALESALEGVCLQAERAVDSGKTILILSDRALDAARAPIPMLLVVSAVHHHLLRVGKRWKTSIIAETGDARDVHHFACLLGYGANAIYPYVALATVRAIVTDGVGRNKGITPAVAQANYLHAAEKGLLKIMSKMGITTLDAYSGAQIFEIIGLSEVVAGRYFTGTSSPISGIDLRAIGRAVLTHHAHSFGHPTDDAIRLKSVGFFKYKKQGEYHAMNPELVDALHRAVRTPGAIGENFDEAFARYREFSHGVQSRPSTDLSDHLDFVPGAPVPLDRVEPIADLVKRFSSAAMSHGSLSIEAHQTIAEAMNRLGALSNSGEGGEHPSRYGTIRNSPIKQVASGRFGVTPGYLVSATELQIKMAQGSKPGEGGQLPGHKVSAEIATIRYSQPGIALISPPPHHDIYSIEDLAQLIYDLKRINPGALVSVKLVSQAGVGTIAAGVAKAYADIIQISGHSGGTGASPLSSIKHAGVAWELGLAETQQILVANDLRGRVRLRVDGGLKTGRHVVLAAMLGADEFSFGTAALVASGCIMARACHLNTCPVGIATQRQELRAKFPQMPEWVMAYFLFVAQETREILASLGVCSVDEIIGRVDRLQINSAFRTPHPEVIPMALHAPQPA
ncbi:MAG: glutamate synthase large subunit [Anaerolineae bacterium]